MSISPDSSLVQPWFNKKEWQEVATKIFSDELEDRKWAVEMVAAWKMRVGPKLDTSIDVTEDLVSATLEFDQTDLELLPAKTKSLQTHYSMAIIRFINYVIQQTQCQEQGITQALAQVGLPECLANLQHDAAHREYPNLDMLRHGTQAALEWLQDHYWQPEDSCIQDFCPRSQAIVQLLARYQKAAYQVYLDSTQLGATEPEVMKNHSSTLSSILDKLNNFLTKNQFKFFELLACPGHLLPPTFYITTLEQAKGERYVESEDVPAELPAVSQALWQPLLKLINSHGLLQVLAESLLLAQCCYSTLADRMIITWVSYLLTLDETHQLGIIPVWDWQPLLKCALTSPSKYILEILPVFLESQDPPLSQERKEKILSLLVVYMGALTDPKDKAEPQSLFSRRDIEAFQHGILLEQHPDSNPGTWCLYEEPDPFHPLPLGSFIMDQSPAVAEDQAAAAKTEAESNATFAAAIDQLPKYPQHRPLSLEDLEVKSEYSPSALMALEKYLDQTVLM